MLYPFEVATQLFTTGQPIFSAALVSPPARHCPCAQDGATFRTGCKENLDKGPPNEHNR